MIQIPFHRKQVEIGWRNKDIVHTRAKIEVHATQFRIRYSVHGVARHAHDRSGVALEQAHPGPNVADCEYAHTVGARLQPGVQIAVRVCIAHIEILPTCRSEDQNAANLSLRPVQPTQNAP